MDSFITSTFNQKNRAPLRTGRENTSSPPTKTEYNIQEAGFLDSLGGRNLSNLYDDIKTGRFEDEQLLKIINEYPSFIIDFAKYEMDARCATLFEIVEAIHKYITPNSQFGSFLIRVIDFSKKGNGVISNLMPEAEAALKRNLDPTYKIQEIVTPNVTESPTNQLLDDICNFWTNNISEQDLRGLTKQIYSLANKFHMDGALIPKIEEMATPHFIYEAIDQNEAIRKKSPISFYTLKENPLVKNPFYYYQKNGTKISVHLKNQEKSYWTQINLIMADSLPVIVETLLRTPTQLTQILNNSYFGKKQQAVRVLLGKTPGTILIIPPDSSKESYLNNTTLNKYSDLEVKFAYPQILHAEMLKLVKAGYKVNLKTPAY